MKYQEALSYIEEANAYGMVLGLESIRELLNRLHNPQDTLQFVHIAGTNGKGSVLAFVSTILTCAGYQVGRYISPTVLEYRERFQINGSYIAKKDLGILMEKIKIACEEMMGAGFSHPTPFEMETALAFLYFKEKNCDIVVLEAGLGGSMDATNIIKNTIAAVITPISLDHIAVLGNTLEEIAQNKAGIIKNNCYVISATQEKVVEEILVEETKKQESLFRMADSKQISAVKSSLKKQVFTYKKNKNMELKLLGTYQISNAITALETIDALRECGYQIEQEAVREGLARTEWFGRCSVLADNPMVMIDGAHNEEAAKKLAETISFHFTNKKIIYIMGVLKDKEYEKIIRETYSYATHIITITPPNNPRALHAYDLAQAVREYHKSVTVADSLEEAIEIAYLLANTSKDTVLIAFGSLSYLGAFSQIIANRKQLKFSL